MKKLEGLIAAPHTPFNADGSVNLDLIPKAEGHRGLYLRHHG